MLSETAPVVNDMVLHTSEFVKKVDPVECSYSNTTNRQNKGKQRVWEVLDMRITLTVVMISWKFTYVQTHRIVHMKCVQFFVY